MFSNDIFIITVIIGLLYMLILNMKSYALSNGDMSAKQFQYYIYFSFR